MNSRIKQLRKALNLTQSEFADRLGMKGNSICSLENGQRNLTDLTAKSICREFNVEYEWLTEGTGEMFHQNNDEDLLGQIGDLLSEKDEFTRNFFKTFANLPEEDWEVIKKVAENLLSKQ